MHLSLTIGACAVVASYLTSAVPNFAQSVSERSTIVKPSDSSTDEVDGLRTLADGFADKLANHEAGKVIDVDFEGYSPGDLGGEDERVGSYLAVQFSDALLRSGYKLKVIDRRQYTLALSGLHARFENDYMPSEPLSVVRSIGADTVVQGSYLFLGDKIRLTVSAFRIARTVDCISIEVGVLKLPFDVYGFLKVNRVYHFGDPREQPDGSDDLRHLISKNFTFPKCVYCPKPAFAIEGQPSAPSGNVALLALITVDGRPTHIRVEKSLSPERDQQAVRTVKDWRYKPATKTPGGSPVACDTPILVTFQPQ